MVAIGARYNKDNGNDTGHTRVYKYENGDWKKLGADIDGEAAENWSGNSISFNFYRGYSSYWCSS